MTLTDLRYILALAQERHFGRAAETCHVSQPTLSVAVKKLEEQLGVLLFERSAADVKVTEIGRRIVEQAERVLHEANQIRDIAEAGRDSFSGPLHLGVIYTIGPYLLPSLVPLLAARAPRMPLVIQENYTHRLAEQLKKGEIDVAILALPFQEPGIVTQPVYDEPFRIVLPKHHAWAKNESISAEQLQEEPLLLLGAGNCFRDQVLEACPHIGGHSTGSDSLEGSSLETIRHMVASGMGVAVMPSTAADPLSGMVKCLPFADAKPMRRIGLVWRITFPRPQAIDAVSAAIRSCKLPGTKML